LYDIQNLPAGEYVVLTNDGFHFRTTIVTGVMVYDGQITNVDIVMKSDFYTDDSIWSETWYSEFGQTFIARGFNIIKITGRNAASPATFNVSVHEGGPGGPQIGPTRTFGCGNWGRGTARWSAGEIQKVPGQRYYVKMVKVEGGTWSSALDANGNSYPNGVAYFDGNPVEDQDLGLTIDCDSDGYITTVNSRYRTGGIWVGEARQSFIANTKDIITAAAVVGTTGTFDFSILTSGGVQIGPTKTVVGWANDARGCAAAWGPGEVSVNPGSAYYLRIRNHEGGGFYIYYANDTYSGGCAYFDGTQYSGVDLDTRIMGRVPDKPSLGLSNINVSPTSTTATITWTTSVASTSQVEYWQGDPLWHIWTDLDETLTTNHSVVLTGLNPGTTYKYRVRSYREGYEYAVSNVLQFTTTTPTGRIAGTVYDENWQPLPNATVTANPGGFSTTTGPDGTYSLLPGDEGTYSVTASKPGYEPQVVDEVVVEPYSTTTVNMLIYAYGGNLLTNGSFESGNTNGWTVFGEGGDVASGPWFGGIEAKDGTYFYGKARHGGAAGTGGLYQQVSVTPGTTYYLSAWSCIYWGNTNATSTQSRIGINPYGSTDPNATSTIWSNWDMQSLAWTAEWHLLEVEATAHSSTITIFLEYYQNNTGGDQWHINCFDDATLSSPENVTTSPAGWIKPGWNLVSLPRTPSTQDAGDALRSLVAVGNTVDNNLYKYVPGSGYMVYPGDFNDVDKGEGYWMYITTGATLTIEGNRTTGTFYLPLSSGWNLIGSGVDGAVSLSNVQVSNGAQTKTLSEAEAAGWLQAVFYYYDGVYKTAQLSGGDDSYLRPWYGYWILALQDNLTLLIPSP